MQSHEPRTHETGYSFSTTNNTIILPPIFSICKMFDNKLSADDRAVSPVVGVILMVAITVILAAVIGTFVLDLGSNQSAPPRAGLSYEEEASGDITITVTDPGNLNNLRFEADAGSVDAMGISDPPTAGDTATWSGASDGDTIRAVGESNGEEAVVSSYTYTA